MCCASFGPFYIRQSPLRPILHSQLEHKLETGDVSRGSRSHRKSPNFSAMHKHCGARGLVSILICLSLPYLSIPHGHVCHSSPTIGIGFFFVIDHQLLAWAPEQSQYCSFYGTNCVTSAWSRETIRREIYHRE